MRGVLIIVCLALAGCAAPPRLPAEPVVVEGREGVRPVARLHSEVMVRAFLEDEEGQRREVGNADCVLETPYYTARFRSPAQVVVPFYGGASPPLDVTCQAADLSGTVRRPVAFRTVDPYPWHRPWWDPWHRDPFHRRGASVWLGLDFGPPAWGRRLVYYPDIGVLMR